MVQLQPGLFLEKLHENHSERLREFDCGHRDTNDFNHNAAVAYQRENLGKTYLILDKVGRIHSFITIAMGVLKVKDEQLALNLGSLDKPSQLPALRIARLGTANGEQGKGFGTMALEAVGSVFEFLQEHVGTRFIIVDAVPERVNWYAKRGFKSVFSDISGRETVPMYFMPPLEPKLN